MYTEELWQEWSAKEEENYIIKDGKRIYLKKRYLHFDRRFWFPEQKERLQQILAARLFIFDRRFQRKAYWAFDPFIKILLKTPRFRYQEAEGEYILESKIRPISFASHIDSLILGFYAFGLNKIYESYIKSGGFADSVLAYRSDLGKCNIQFSKEVFRYIKKKGECTAIALDIKGYFDNIDHLILKDKWCKVIGSELPEDQYRLYRILTKYSYVSSNSILKKYNIDIDKEFQIASPKMLLDFIPGDTENAKFTTLRKDQLIVKNEVVSKYARKIGIPQGSSMSALLSNIYLLDFDKELHEKAMDEGFLYRRYCDDILIVCDTEKATELQRFVMSTLEGEQCRLPIQEKKIELIEFKKDPKGQIRSFNRKKINDDSAENEFLMLGKKYYKPLQYLGFEYNGKNILIRSSSLSRFYRKMKNRIEKTIGMGYSSKSQSDIISKEQLFRRYTHIGERNFLTYAYNAAQPQYKNSAGEWKEGMDSRSIKRQLKRHMDILTRTLDEKNKQRFDWKSKQGKATKLKKV